MKVTTKLRQWAEQHGLSKAATDDDARQLIAKALDDRSLQWKEFVALTKEGSSAAKLFGGNGNGNGTSRGYSKEKSIGVHQKTGQPVSYLGRPVQTPSELETVKAGAFLRSLALRSPVWADAGLRPLDNLERDLLGEMREEDEWSGEAPGGQVYSKVRGSLLLKADLLNDSTSGGANLVPVWFDENLVLLPLLQGEIAPFVNITEMPLSNVVQTGLVGNPTTQWGVAEGTPLTPFDCTGLVSLINSTVQVCQSAVLVGRDMLNDSPAAVGQALVGALSQRLQAELDRVCAVGNGTSEPTGFTVGAAVATGSGNSTSGPPVVADYEALMFGIGKQYRLASFNPSFVANDTSYARARGIAVGPADERRVFGMTHSDYMLLDRPYRIVPGLPNTKQCFVALQKYRLWKRAGIDIRWEQGGRTLSLAHEALLIARMRVAGKLVDPNACCVIVDGQS